LNFCQNVKSVLSQALSDSAFQSEHFSLICRHSDFQFSGRPPSWICDDVIILHPLIDFHGPNIVVNFHVDWFGSNKPHLCAIGDKQRDRRRSSLIEASFLLRGFQQDIARQVMDWSILHFRKKERTSKTVMDFNSEKDLDLLGLTWDEALDLT